jgi:cytochrome oxidase Cu insertion factor (SCO1/SenC/PrrC family)
MTAGRLAALSVLVAVGGLAAYLLLFDVAVVRNHPEGYVLTFAVAVVLAGLALRRSRRWYVWPALALSLALLVLGAWNTFVVARIPDTPTALRVGEHPPDFTLPDASGRPVSLADYRGKKPVILVFYRGHW